MKLLLFQIVFSPITFGINFTFPSFFGNVSVGFLKIYFHDFFKINCFFPISCFFQYKSYPDRTKMKINWLTIQFFNDVQFFFCYLTNQFFKKVNNPTCLCRKRTLGRTRLIKATKSLKKYQFMIEIYFLGMLMSYFYKTNLRQQVKEHLLLKFKPNITSLVFSTMNRDKH